MAYQIKFQGLGVKKGDSAVMATDQPIQLKEVDEAKMTFVAVASTEAEDRDKDILRTDGWVLDNYLKNPVGLWCHDYHAIPVFKCLRVRKDMGQKALIFEPQFADYDFAKLVFNMYVKGFMSAFSVGFIPLKVAPREADQPWWVSGQEYTEQELLEISSVPVPANPEALSEIRGVGLVKDHKPTLLEAGFSTHFAKSAEHGLYMPVQDPGLFTDARIVNLSKGIKVVSGMPVADPEAKVAPPVAYIFDPEQFDAKAMHEWLSANVPNEQQRKYFDLKPKNAEDAEKPFEIEIIEVKEASSLPNLEVLQGLLVEPEGKTVEDGGGVADKFTHNSTTKDGEPSWGDVDKTSLPQAAFADHGEAGKKSTWKYPHHWISGGSAKDDEGVYTDGTMYLHKGGLDAAWAAANGARSGEEASQAVKDHLQAHRKALGLDDSGKDAEGGKDKGAVEDNNLNLGSGGGEIEDNGGTSTVTASFLSVTFALLDSDQNPIEGKSLTKTIEVKDGEMVDMETLMGSISESIGKEILANLAEIKQLVVDISAKTGETKTDGNQNANQSETVLEVVTETLKPKEQEPSDQTIELDESLFASPDKGAKGSQGVIEIDLTEAQTKEVINGTVTGALKTLFTEALAEMGVKTKK